MLGGRVKTLHPTIHGGILADRSNPDHLADLEARGITPIDLVVANLYPFTSDPGIELIDIGGPTMVRAAAKNHAHVGDRGRPGRLRRRARGAARATGALSDATRRRLARAAFAHTAAYDAAIVAWFDEEPTARSLPPATSTSPPEPGPGRCATARTPTRSGPATASPGCAAGGTTPRSTAARSCRYLNLYDAEAAWRLVHELGDGPAAVVIKHANPCGAAVAERPHHRLHAGPTSATRSPPSAASSP